MGKNSTRYCAYFFYTFPSVCQSPDSRLESSFRRGGVASFVIPDFPWVFSVLRQRRAGLEFRL